jgi:putative ABC transport system permease protein
VLSDLYFRLRSLLRRRTVQRELDDELRFHVEQQVKKYIESGLTREQALRRSRLEFGHLDQVKEDCQEARGVNFIESLFQDVRYGLRMLRKSPGFAAVAVLTLALGIGANTAIFSIVDAVLLRPLPFKNAGRVVDVTEYSPGKVDSTGVPYPDYLVWKQANTVFDETAAYFLISASNDIVLGGPFSAERARYSTVTNSFFTILGVQPALGRGFSASDETPGAEKVFLVSDAVWHGVFGGDPHAIGKAYLLDGENYTLIGVMPPGFDYPKGCGVWVSVGTLGQFGLHDRISHPFHVLGRLRPGVNLIQAEGQIESFQKRLGEMYPNTDADWHIRAQPLLDEVVGNVRTSLLVLLGAVGFILLIACTNVVNLMLARASAREQEFAIRTALGAGRMRLLSQNLTESFLIVCISVVLAVAFAKGGLTLAVSLTSIHLPRMESFQLSIPVLAFMAAIAALTTLVVGLAPSLQAARKHSQTTLRSGERSAGTDLHSSRLRDVLIVSEVALALILLCGAGLMFRSFLQLNRVNPGFQPEHLLTLKIALPSAAYPRAEQTSAFLDQLLERLQSLPSVQVAAATSALPLSGESDWGSFQIVGRGTQDWAHALAAEGRAVSVDYFRTLGIPLLRGRQFSASGAHHDNGIIINEAMARKFFLGTDPIGQHIVSIDQRSEPREIVGVVADVKSFGLASESKPEMYGLYRGAWYMNFVLRTTQDPASAASAVRKTVALLDTRVPVYQVATMDQLLSDSFAPERFNLFLLGLFAALALSLAAVGLYGVLSFAVSRRTHEIGVRLAIGGQRRDILRLIAGQGMTLVIIGLALGLAASFLLTRLMASLLYDVSATDPMTFGAVAVLLALTAFSACYIPARRAMRTDPLVALRHE